MARCRSRRKKSTRCFPTVAETIADALGCDVEDVKPDVSLIEDLDAESIDFLDMVFRLERAFKIKIPRGKIVENARGDLTEAEFEQKGIVTETGLAQLREYLSEVPAERFKTPMKVDGHSAAVHAGDVLQARASRAQQEAPAAAALIDGSRMSADHFAAFSFVDRITEFEPAKRARGTLRRPAAHRRVSVVPRRRGGRPARRVGAMAHIDFRGRPVAALADGDALPRRRRSPATRSTSRSTSTTATTTRSPTAAARSVDGTTVHRAHRLPRADAAASTSSTRPTRCASASRCCAAAARRPAASAACAPHRVTTRRARARRVGARDAGRAASRAVLRRSFSAPAGVSGDAAARRADRASRSTLAREAPRWRAGTRRGRCA